MLVARSFVLSVNSRAALAIALVAMGVAYAVLTGAAVSGLRAASETSSLGLLHPPTVLARPGLATFDAASLPAGSTVYTGAPWEGGTLGTVRPWPFGEEAVPGPYAHAAREAIERLGLPQGAVPGGTAAPGTWVLIPPDRFDALHPELKGRGTFATVSQGTPPPPGFESRPAAAAQAFYVTGAEQVFGSVQLVVVAMGVTVSVLAAGVLRLEVLARERDLATLEALGGARLARRAVVLRTLVVVGAGAGLGVAGGMAVARLAGRALGVGFRVDLGVAAEAVLVAVVAGSVAGVASGLARMRAPVASRLGGRGPAARPFPGPVRFLLVTPRVAPSVLAAALVLASVGSVVLAAASVPATMFAPADGTVVLGTSEGNPFRGATDRFVGEHAAEVTGINASSPETVAPTVIAGHPVVVRGVLFSGWRALDAPSLVRGAWPASPAEASAGARLAQALGIHVGQDLLVPGAYRATLRVLHVTAIHEGAGLLDDELLTDLDTAGDLAGLAPTETSFVRLRGDQEALARLASAGIVVANLTVDPAEPVPNTQAVAVVRLTNLASVPAERLLNLRANGQLAASTVARLGPHTTGVVTLTFLVPEKKLVQLQVNPTLNVTTSNPDLSLEVAASVAPNRTFPVRAALLDGTPAAGAELRSGDRVLGTTGADGTLQVAAGSPGVMPIEAELGGRRGGAVVFVVEPAWALSPHLAAVRATVLASSEVGADQMLHQLMVVVANLGGAPFQGALNVTANGTTLAAPEVVLAARQEQTVPVSVTVPGNVTTIEVDGLRVAVPARPPASPAPPAPTGPAPASEPRSVKEVLEARLAAKLAARTTQELSGASFLSSVFATLNPSVTVVVLATFLNASAGVAAAVIREVRERAEVVEVLEQIGVTREQLQARAAREALLSALPALVVGAAGAAVALQLLQARAFPAAFGHTIPVPADAGFTLRVVGALALVAVLSAAWAARAGGAERPAQATPRALRDLLAGGP